MTTFTAVLIVSPTAHPGRVVAGLSLARRNVLTARAAGAVRTLVVDADPLRRAAIAEGDPTVVGVAPSEVVTTLAHDDDVLVASATSVHEPHVYDALVRARPGSPCGLASPAARLPVFRLPAAVARTVPWQQVCAAERLTPDAMASFVDLDDARSDPGAFAVAVDDDAEAARAADALWTSCRKASDGIISRHLNRRVSLLVSRTIVGTSLTPNQLSIFCIALGVVAAVVTAFGGYTAILVGSILFKLNSVLDGVDGEIARVKWQKSEAGALLDSAGDNVANFAFFGALTFAAWTGGSTWLAQLGVAALAMWALYLGFIYSRLHAMKRGDGQLVRTAIDETQNAWVQTVVQFLRRILRRDAFVMLMLLMAVAGIGELMLVPVFVGASITFGSACLHWAVSLVRLSAAGRKETDG